ncbi:MAG: AAC(3) family N-acetyltransferase [Candidatus Latescibacteria bacterium]|nr:AAC(3) family N-acetyltransferase [Candidatus Latescibacterota bacterium]
MPHTRSSLVRDLHALGVTPGDLLFVHASFRSLGPVEGGAETVVRALEDALGPDGLLLMPSFNLVEPDRRAETWDIRTTPSTTGWLTEFFRRMPGTHRSDHYSHAVSARGKGAEAFVADHLSREGLRSPWDREPWGRTYGTHAPMHRAYEAGGKILMLGVDYHSSTYAHFVEVLHWNRRREQDPEARYRYLKRPELGAFWDWTGDLRRGSVGDAGCRLFLIRDYVHALLQEVETNPEPYVK